MRFLVFLLFLGIGINAGAQAIRYNQTKLPAQAGNVGKFITTDGTIVRWTDTIGISRIITPTFPNVGAWYTNPANVVYGDSTLIAKKFLDSVLARKDDTGHVHSAAEITSGALASARLGAGTATDTYVLTSDAGVPTWSPPPAGGSGDFTVVEHGYNLVKNYDNSFLAATPNADSIPTIDFVIDANTMELGEVYEVTVDGYYLNNTGGNTNMNLWLFRNAVNWSSAYNFTGNIATNAAQRAVTMKWRFIRSATSTMRYSFEWAFSGTTLQNGFFNGGLINTTNTGKASSYSGQTCDFTVANTIKIYLYPYNVTTANNYLDIHDYKVIKYAVPL